MFAVDAFDLNIFLNKQCLLGTFCLYFAMGYELEKIEPLMTAIIYE